MTSMLEALKRIEERRPCVPPPDPPAPQVEVEVPCEPEPVCEEPVCEEPVCEEVVCAEPVDAPLAEAVEGGRPQAWNIEELLARRTDAPGDPYRQLAANLLSQLDPSRASALLFGGPSDVPGRATAVARLARMLAGEVPGGVLAVDVDVHHPGLARQFAVKADRGLGDVLLGTADWEDVVRRSGVAGLDLLSGRPFPAESLLGRPNAAWLLDELKERYRLVLLDAGRLEPDATAPWARCCDGTYLVAGLGTTTARAARRALRRINASGGRVLGCMLTQ